MADRDCENCKHYEWTSDHTVQGCSVWECPYEREDAIREAERINESTEKSADGQTETGDMCNASL